MKYSEFLEAVPDSRIDICQHVYLANRDKIKIKKEKTVIKNLEKIADALLKIDVDRGFQAMSMRDLSHCSNLSLGALYSYFSSKDEMLRAFLSEGTNMICDLIEGFIEKKPIQFLKKSPRSQTGRIFAGG